MSLETVINNEVEKRVTVILDGLSSTLEHNSNSLIEADEVPDGGLQAWLTVLGG